MADIFHNLPIKGSSRKVFEAISTPLGLNAWWTNNCRAIPSKHAAYELEFGPGYLWQATASEWLPDSTFELQIIDGDDDWRGTRVGFRLIETDDVTNVAFYHLGWPENNEHYQTSCFCWAMYLRLLKRYVEFGEVVPYANRLEV